MSITFLKYFYTITTGFHWVTGLLGSVFAIFGLTTLIMYINNEIDQDYLKWYVLSLIAGIFLIVLCGITPTEEGVLFLINHP